MLLKPAGPGAMLLALAGSVLAAAGAGSARTASAADPAAAGCTCAAAKAAGGWCDEHELGYVAGVEIRSEILFDAVDAHGHDLDLATFTCPECRSAIESDGFCSEHRIGFVGGQAYFSKLTYLLARGELRSPGEIACPVCRRNAESHGFCSSCGVGMAGHVAVRGRPAYDELEREIRILEAAAEAAKRCGHCGAAALGNSTCPYCKISYSGGVAVPAAVPEPK